HAAQSRAGDLRDRAEAISRGAVGGAPPAPGEVRQAGELQLPVRLRVELSLFRRLAAGFDLRAPVFDAPGAVHRAFADDFREQEIGEQLDLARLESGRRIGQARTTRLQVGLLHAVAAPVAVGELVEGGHAPSRAPA